MRVGVVGLIVPLSQSYTLLPHEAPGLQLLWQRPLTQPHLLVPRPALVALLQRKSVKTKTRLCSMSQIMMDLLLASIWGGVRSTNNTQNIKFIRA